jgi:hypothetical protein
MDKNIDKRKESMFFGKDLSKIHLSNLGTEFSQASRLKPGKGGN